MKFARENFSAELVAEIRPLLESHDQEIPQFHMPLDPDFILYKAMDAGGVLRIFTLRFDTVLRGYQIFFVHSHPHRKTSKEATQDILYVVPGYRKGLAAIKFMKWCDEELAKEGVKMIHHPIDARHDFGLIFKRMGYELADLTYSRRLY